MKNALEKFRLEQGLTYAAIAKMVGLNSRSTVFQHCRGQRGISAESALKYSQYLGIPCSELRPDLWPPDACQPVKSLSAVPSENLEGSR